MISSTIQRRRSYRSYRPTSSIRLKMGSGFPNCWTTYSRCYWIFVCIHKTTRASTSSTSPLKLHHKLMKTPLLLQYSMMLTYPTLLQVILSWRLQCQWCLPYPLLYRVQSKGKGHYVWAFEWKTRWIQPFYRIPKTTKMLELNLRHHHHADKDSGYATHYAKRSASTQSWRSWIVLWRAKSNAWKLSRSG